jgi:hypothetical protein
MGWSLITRRATIDRLSKSDPRNTVSQRDLATTYGNIGHVQVVQGNLAAALSSYQASFAIRDRLAKSDPVNLGWQHDLSISYSQIGDVQVRQGKLSDALTSYQASVAIDSRLGACLRNS